MDIYNLREEIEFGGESFDNLFNKSLLSIKPKSIVLFDGPYFCSNCHSFPEIKFIDNKYILNNCYCKKNKKIEIKEILINKFI